MSTIRYPSYVGSGGGGGSDTVITDNGNGTYTADPNGGQSAVTWASFSGLNINQIAFVDPVNGNNTTGLVGRIDRPFQTIAGAFGAGNTLTTIWCWAGSHVVTTPLTITGSTPRHFHFVPNAWLITSSWLWQGSGVFCFITGNGIFQLGDVFGINLTPATTFNNFYVEGDRVFSGGATNFLDNTSCQTVCRIKQINGLTVSGTGYCSAQIFPEYWDVQGSSFVSYGDAIQFNAGTWTGIYGTAKTIIKNGQLIARDGSLAFQSQANADKLSQLIVDTNLFLENSVGFFWGSGNVRHYGETRTSNNGSFGAEMPVYSWTQVNSAINLISTATVKSDSDNTIGQFDSSVGGIIGLFGRYYTQGETFPCMRIGESNTANRTMIFGGRFANFGNSCDVIRFNNINTQSSEYTFQNAVVVNSSSATPPIDSIGNPVNIKVTGSLTTNLNPNPSIVNISVMQPIYVSTNLTNSFEEIL